MEHYDLVIQTITLSLGVAWASGINLYAVLLVLGIGGLSGELQLPTELTVLESPLVIAAAGAMYCIEFIVDKTPGLDTGWDGIHSFIRIPAGAMLAAAAIGDSSPAFEVAAAIVGGSLSGVSHVTKASSRIMINTSPEPLSNWITSITEDILVVAGLWTALNHPMLFLMLLAIFIAIVIWLLPKIVRLIVRLLSKIKQRFSKHKPAPKQPESVSTPLNSDQTTSSPSSLQDNQS